MVPGDLDEILRHNNDAVPAVNALTRPDLEWFAEHAHSFLVVDGPGGADDPGDPRRSVAGFLIGLVGPGLAYDSDNYRWFSARYDRFVYVDRVVVADGGRGAGVGSQLYEEFAGRGRRDGHPVLLAEVNIRPRNDGSLRFHERHGFRAVGEQDTEGGAKRVVLLEKRL
ncbi:MAG: GNAT family N-acetyltransferase [Acidimicrobiales bacterium]